MNQSTDLVEAEKMLLNLGMPRLLTYILIYGVYIIGVYILTVIVIVFLIAAVNTEVLSSPFWQRSVIILFYIIPSMLIVGFFLLIGFTSIKFQKKIQKLKYPESYTNLYVITSFLKNSPAYTFFVCFICLVLIFLISKSLFTASNLLYLS